MRAVGYKTPGPITSPESLVDITLPDPVASGHDLLVEVKAVSVNPVDTKVRSGAAPVDGEYRILGFDAAGVVKAVGENVSLFKPGDEVYYAGSIARPGTNSELHLVDERIAGFKPKSLGFAEAAALPLTTITAYEALFDRLRVEDKVPGANHAILITGGAGGVGSITIQLARQLTDLTIIATASRPETAEWVKALGAHHVIDHSKPLAAEYAAPGIGAPAFIYALTQSEQHADAFAEIIAPQGRIAIIDDPKGGFDIMRFKRKAVSVHWEFMFTRAVFQTPDMIEQHRLLNKVADMIDAGTVRTTLADTFGTITAENLKKAHAAVESGRTRGKIVLEGF
ncbi:zinc-binding alcohol dehydrogenase family protein [Ciceribacter sp. L1K23]|uniref:zinc-binding alcohol dehydrogenase family protein n=1 Tax=Ciceribacter sp. L1K23 TaxID=2820276 RepID=UPI001B83418F|nr:zinc-binding alcohol dehydrogenase family protein [Ciceribacter sp. L1K23]MBR0556290.1 zinc-binding alcohol dehydrogenase family protein [Ciceribacter sp. L1K23]